MVHGEVNDSPTSSRAELLDRARELQATAAAEGLTLRLLGSLGVYHSCPSSRDLMVDLGRGPTVDIDFMGASKQSRRYRALLEGLGYELHPDLVHSQEFGVSRLVFEGMSPLPKVDIFLDSLDMAHKIDLRSRIDLEPITLTRTDLLLSKLQIHELTRNDLVDLCVLLAEQEQGHELFDLRYLTKLMANDWGFCYSALLNLAVVKESLSSFTDLSVGHRDRIAANSDTIAAAIELEPKSMRWKMRAKMGPKVKWYEEVEELR